jgi:hypothetical protein
MENRQIGNSRKGNSPKATSSKISRWLGANRLGGSKKKKKADKNVDFPPIVQWGLGIFVFGMIGMILPTFGLELWRLRRVGPVGGGAFALIGALAVGIGYSMAKRFKEGLSYAAPMLLIAVTGIVLWQVFPNAGNSNPPVVVESETTSSGQEEYLAAYALTFGLVFLGVLATCIPRPRGKDLPENIAKKEKAMQKRRNQAVKRR